MRKERDIMKDGDILLEKLKEAVREQRRKLLEYLLACPELTPDATSPYQLQGTEDILNAQN